MRRILKIIVILAYFAEIGLVIAFTTEPRWLWILLAIVIPPAVFIAYVVKMYGDAIMQDAVEQRIRDRTYTDPKIR